MSESLNFNGSVISTGSFVGDGSGLNSASNVQVFRGPGAPVITGGTFTWTKPNAGSMVLIECWGAGGGGGEFAGGGGGGGYNYGYFSMAIFPGPAIVTVGAGGISPGTNFPYASPGENSRVSLSPISTIITGWGGGGGGGGDYGVNQGNTGGGGGMAGAGAQNTAGLQGGGPGTHPSGTIGPGLIYGGGAGGAGSGIPTTVGCQGGDSTYGGGGGGAFKDTPAPGPVLGGTSVFGGPGGQGSSPSVNTTPATIPGGGGGAGSSPKGRVGTPGASGQVRITTF